MEDHNMKIRAITPEYEPHKQHNGVLNLDFSAQELCMCNKFLLVMSILRHDFF